MISRLEIGSRQTSVRIGCELLRGISLALLFHSSSDNMPQIIEVDFVILVGQQCVSPEHIVLWRGQWFLLSSAIEVYIPRGNCISEPQLISFFLDLLELHL